MQYILTEEELNSIKKHAVEDIQWEYEKFIHNMSQFLSIKEFEECAHIFQYHNQHGGTFKEFLKDTSTELLLRFEVYEKEHPEVQIMY